ncbi:MAG: metal ABC transporter solute-binding protein, Zn/Mn family [Ilumatobacteraceae bacterium]
MGTTPTHAARLRRHRLAAALAATALAAGLAACGSDDETAAPTSIRVAATLFPLEEIVRGVAGDALGDSVTLVEVVPPGEPAHDAEPTARQLEALEGADVVLYLGGGFQADLEQAIDSLPAGITTVDLLDAVELLPVTDPVAGEDSGDEHGGDEHADEHAGEFDPHVWLSPDRMASMAAAVASVIEQRLTAAGLGAGIDAVRAGLDAFAAEMRDVDTEFASGLALCESSVVVTAHRAFAYLAASFGLTQASIAGISPSDEPSAATLRDVAAYAESNGVTTIFFEESLPDDLSRTVADEIGASVAVLDPLESPSREQRDAGATYSSIMRDNLVALRAGLRCA